MPPSSAHDPMLAPAGLYYMCFCRVDAERSSCGTNSDNSFISPIGLLEVLGPYLGQKFRCDVGTRCNISGVAGIGLSKGDALMALENCSVSESLFSEGYPPVPVHSSDSQGTIYELGALTLQHTVPRVAKLCWCPAEGAAMGDCAAPRNFRADAGNLDVPCPKGFFIANNRCLKCTIGFWCPGGLGDVARKMQCATRKTTVLAGAHAASQCVCVKGAEPSIGSGIDQCVACAPGKFLGASLMCFGVSNPPPTLLSVE